MDSVYDAALKHAEKLKAELKTLQNFLDLHDHFSAHFGLTPSKATSPVTHADVADSDGDHSDAEASTLDRVAATHESLAQESDVEAEDALETSEPTLSEAKAVEPEVVAPLAAKSEETFEESSDAKAPSAAATQSASVGEPRVIKASEGVLIATSSEPEAATPLGPEATLQTVAEKLAATISGSHPSVTGYTV